MYDELVKSLRYCATHDCCGEGEREAGCTAPYSLRKDCGTCNQVLQAEAADAIEELSKPRWIPVAERLPEKDGDYLCWLLGYMSVLRWDGKNWWYVSIGGAYTRYVTHWQELPEPPKEEA